MITRRRFLALSATAAALMGRGKITRKRLQSSSIEFTDEKGETHRVSGFLEKERQFFSLNELAQYLCLPENSDRFIYVDKKQKLVVVKNKQRIIFSSGNTFVRFNDQLVQIYIETINVDDVIYIDAKEFVAVMSEFSSVKFQYNEAARKLTIATHGFNITGINFESKKNGVIARLVTTQDFPVKHVVASVKDVNNKLYISVLNGLINPKNFESSNPNPFVKRVQAVQSDGAAQIVLTVVGKLSRDLIHLKKDDESGDLVFTVSAKLNSAQKKEVEKKREDEIQKKLDQDHDKFMIDTVVIDPGHGGKDPGAVGKLGRKPIYEKTIALDVAKKIQKTIKASMPKLNVVLTRTKDQHIEFYDRGTIANKHNGKLFVSIHTNSNKSSKANGFEIYVSGKYNDERAKKIAFTENKVIELYGNEKSKQYFSGLNLIKVSLLRRAFVKNSFYFAEILHERIGSNLRVMSIKNRGVKQAPFNVLFKPSMPSVLIELAFISNKREVKVLASKTDRSKMAKSIASAIVEYKRDIDSTV